MTGFTPEGRSVHGDAEISVGLGSLTGRVDFRGLQEWISIQEKVDGYWSTWGDGDLGYSIAVSGSSFRKFAGDEGMVSGRFIGRDYEEAIGTLQRQDLAAAFSGSLATGPYESGPCQYPYLSQSCGFQANRPPVDLSGYLNPIIQMGDVPGMIAAIVDVDGIRAIGSAGVRKLGSPEPFTVDDLVHLGSNTKAMTATMLATLVADGTFSKGWQTTIADVFPELMDEIHKDYHDVDLSQLVRMRGGLTEARNWWIHGFYHDVAQIRYGILRDNLANLSEVSVGDFSYSNLSYMVAAAMAERLSGLSWEVLMEERLFVPLGITTAGIGAVGTPNEIDQPWGHQSNEDGIWIPLQFDAPPAMAAGGNIHMSVADWAKFISLWFRTSEPAILDRKTLDELSTPVTGDYAAGWQLFPSLEEAPLMHSGAGGAVSWVSLLRISPDRGIAYLAVANSNGSHSLRYGEVYNLLLSTVAGLIEDSDKLLANSIGGTGREVGGGGGLSVRSQRLNSSVVPSLTGAASPDFVGQDVAASVNQLLTSANALLVSDLHLLANDNIVVRGPTVCQGTVCSTTLLESTLTFTSDGIRFGSSLFNNDAVSSHRGVSLAQGYGKNIIAGALADYDVFGGWLEHSFFSVETAIIAEGLVSGAPLVYSASIGNAPSSNPVASDGSGTWRGVMVGADVGQTETRGQAIQGDAEITIANFEYPQVDVAFTRIVNLMSGAARDDMIWTGISVIDGGFAAGADGDSIEGRFYGPSHEEVGGVFERDDILGSFGATRSMSIQ